LLFKKQKIHDITVFGGYLLIMVRRLLFKK